MRTYLVGGAVRDALLGRSVSDHDYVVVGSTPEKLLAEGFTQVGASFPVFLAPGTGDEYALARKESKNGVGHLGFACEFGPEVTLEEDLSRRDLTVNAMAFDTETKEVVDPFGGRLDLANKVLRHVSDAFSEDPLRVFRVARFAAVLGFSVCEETKEEMRKVVASGELQNLPGERVAKELRKALSGRYPRRFFDVLCEVGALSDFFPEVEALNQVPAGPEKFHGKASAYEHTMRVVERLAGFSVKVVLAGLAHDFGKALTDPEQYPHHTNHEKLGLAPAVAFCKRLRLTSKERHLMVLVVRHHLKLARVGKKSRPGTVFNLLKDFRALQSDQDLLDAYKVSEADVLAHVDGTVSGNRDFVLGALEAEKKVDLKKVLEDVNPRQIAEKVRSARLQALTEHRDSVTR